MIRRWHAAIRRSPRDRGSAALEFVVIAPGLLLIVAVIIFAGRVAIAQQSVDAAAADAARAASISRTQASAGSAARSAATSSLAQQGLTCLNTSTVPDTSGFATPVGTPAFVAATVSCTVNLTDLGAPIPGTRTVTSTVRSPLDTYRTR